VNRSGPILPRESSLDLCRRRTPLLAAVSKASEKRSLTVAEVERWKGAFLAGAKNALRACPEDEEAAKDEQMAKP
jgi:hypothetical protein